MVEVVVEPRGGGRWYEKDEDGFRSASGGQRSSMNLHGE